MTITMRTLTLFSAFIILSGANLRAQTPHLRWIVKSDRPISTDRAERVYLEACRWVEDHFGYVGQQVRPNLTVHVGEPCPNPELSGPCTSASEGELYLPRWDKSSVGAVAQATVLAALIRLIDRQELKNIARDILADDARDFLDASEVAMANE
jgi:hypothetical protein